MIIFLIECLLLGFCCGLCAAVYRGVLAYEPVLHFWFQFGQRFENKWFFKPVWGCSKCIAGQLALWVCLIVVKIPHSLTPGGQGGANGATALQYAAAGVAGLFGLILAISTGIISAMLLHPLIYKLQNN